QPRRLPPRVARSRAAALLPARVPPAPPPLRRLPPTPREGEVSIRPYKHVCSHMAEWNASRSSCPALPRPAGWLAGVQPPTGHGWVACAPLPPTAQAAVFSATSRG